MDMDAFFVDIFKNHIELVIPFASQHCYLLTPLTATTITPKSRLIGRTRADDTLNVGPWPQKSRAPFWAIARLAARTAVQGGQVKLARKFGCRSSIIWYHKQQVSGGAAESCPG